jgi:hypothetical protein
MVIKVSILVVWWHEKSQLHQTSLIHISIFLLRTVFALVACKVDKQFDTLLSLGDPFSFMDILKEQIS